MMGNLFYRRVSPEEIANMTYHEIEYWNTWHETIAKVDRGE